MRRRQKVAVIVPFSFLLLALLVYGGLGQPARPAGAATAFPEKTITWIVPTAPGGGYDTYARAFIPFLRKYLPHRTEIVVKNIPGAGGINGTRILYKSKPDGYTIGYTITPGIWIARLTRDIGFDPGKLTNIAQIATSPQGLFVAGKSPINSVADLKKKDKVILGARPKGSSMYGYCVIVPKIMGFDADIVTGYGGVPEIIAGIMRGDVEGAVLNIPVVARYVESGDLKPIVSFTPKRSKIMPNVPSVTELGYDEATAIASDWKMLFGPPGLPKETVVIYQNALTKAFADKDLLAWSEKTAMPIELLTGNDVAMQLKKIQDAYQKYIELYR